MSVTVEDIIKQVRWCIDKEATSKAYFDDVDQDDTFLSNIITAHIGDALFWCSYYCSSQLLSSTASGGLITYISLTGVNTPEKKSMTMSTGTTYYYGKYTLPDNFVKLVRVRLHNWNKAINNAQLISEYSDEYLELKNEIATATNENPKAAILDTYPKKTLELYPYSGNGEDSGLTIAVVPDTATYSKEDEVEIPNTLKAGFYYYLAFLTLSAYGDTNANQMLEIAKMNIGLTDSNDS